MVTKSADSPPPALNKHARAERLANLADHLAPADRELIRAVYAQGRSYLELACLLNIAPEAVRRRADRLARRMLSTEFAFAALRHEHWPPRLSQVARACLLEGRSLRAAAATLNLSMHAVRRMRDQVVAMAHGAQDTHRMLDESGR